MVARTLGVNTLSPKNPAQRRRKVETLMSGAAGWDAPKVGPLAGPEGSARERLSGAVAAPPNGEPMPPWLRAATVHCVVLTSWQLLMLPWLSAVHWVSVTCLQVVLWPCTIAEPTMPLPSTLPANAPPLSDRTAVAAAMKKKLRFAKMFILYPRCRTGMIPCSIGVRMRVRG